MKKVYVMFKNYCIIDPCLTQPHTDPTLLGAWLAGEKALAAAGHMSPSKIIPLGRGGFCQ